MLITRDTRLQLVSICWQLTFHHGRKILERHVITTFPEFLSHLDNVGRNHKRAILSLGNRLRDSQCRVESIFHVRTLEQLVENHDQAFVTTHLDSDLLHAKNLRVEMTVTQVNIIRAR